MKTPFIQDKWEYDIIKNEGKGLQGYGWRIEVYKNDTCIYKNGNFGSIQMARLNAQDYFLLAVFDIERDNYYLM
jgi:hypothetical protein